MQLELNEEQLDFIIDECKSTLEFSDWFGSTKLTREDVDYLYNLVSLIRECIHIQEDTKDA